MSTWALAHRAGAWLGPPDVQNDIALSGQRFPKAQIMQRIASCAHQPCSNRPKDGSASSL
eukprot:366150-Chlamydomonas_euryale.AAC.13